MSSKYWELLKDPRWQQMRLRILDRDQWQCQECRSRDKTLHVHHTYYSKGAKPWEYPMDALITLCEDCHKVTGEQLEELRRLVGGLDRAMLAVVTGYVRAMLAVDSFGALSLIISSELQAIGAADYIGVSDADLLASRDAAGVVSGAKLSELYWKRLAARQIAQAIDALEVQPETSEDEG